VLEALGVVADERTVRVVDLVVVVEVRGMAAPGGELRGLLAGGQRGQAPLLHAPGRGSATGVE
jgi:hypothetical protein